MFGTYFGTVSFFMISMPEKNLSGVFSEPHLDFCDKCNHVLHSFQYLTSAKEYKGTYSGLQIRPCLTCERQIVVTGICDVCDGRDFVPQCELDLDLDVLASDQLNAANINSSESHSLQNRLQVISFNSSSKPEL